jgi:hypothetical protein
MSLTFALGLFVIWVIGFPGYIFYVLYKQRGQLDNEELVITYGLFYVGLRDNAYYWEVIISNVRKVFFVSFNSLLFDTKASVKGLLAVLLLFIHVQFLRN